MVFAERQFSARLAGDVLVQGIGVCIRNVDADADVEMMLLVLGRRIEAEGYMKGEGGRRRRRRRRTTLILLFIVLSFYCLGGFGGGRGKKISKRCTRPPSWKRRAPTRLAFS